MSNLNPVSRLLVISGQAVDSSLGEMWQMRAKQPLVPRVGKVGLDFMLKSERIRTTVETGAARYLARPLGDMVVLNHGSEQIVMEDGDSNVVKLLMSSIGKDRATSQATAERLQSESDTCASYLGDLWLPTKFEAVKYGRNNKSAVVARQPLLTDAVFYRTERDVEPDERTKVMAEKMLDLHEDTGLIADLFGLNNIALRSEPAELCIVDTVPVSYARKREISERDVRGVATVEAMTVSQLAKWAA